MTITVTEMGGDMSEESIVKDAHYPLGEIILRESGIKTKGLIYGSRH